MNESCVLIKHLILTRYSYMKANFDKKIIGLDMLMESDIQEHAVIEQWRYVKKNREEELKQSKDQLSSV